MTPQEERQYLCELILASSTWRISEGDETDAIRLEVQDRLRRLNGVNTVDENGFAQSEPKIDIQLAEAGRAIEPIDKHKAAKERWKADKVRVRIGGKIIWKPRVDCHMELMPGSKTKKHWVWNLAVDQDKGITDH